MQEYDFFPKVYLSFCHKLFYNIKAQGTCPMKEMELIIALVVACLGVEL